MRLMQNSKHDAIPFRCVLMRRIFRHLREWGSFSTGLLGVVARCFIR